MIGNKTLCRYYKAYNEVYFKNELPACETVFRDLQKMSKGAIGHYTPVEYEIFRGGKWTPHRKTHRIEIDPKAKYMNVLWQSTLLHEMAHLSVGLKHKRVKSHGTIWQKEMLRLATAGAFKNLW